MKKKIIHKRWCNLWPYDLHTVKFSTPEVMKKHGGRLHGLSNYVESFYSVLLKVKKKIYNHHIRYYIMIISTTPCSQNTIRRHNIYNLSRMIYCRFKNARQQQTSTNCKRSPERFNQATLKRIKCLFVNHATYSLRNVFLSSNS